MIKVENLSMIYEQAGEPLTVLKDINFAMSGGDTVAIVGPSGSGKTTLLQLLAFLESPSSGSISMDGQVLNSLDDDALADFRREHMGIIFQSFHLIQSLTALGNTSIPLDIAGRSGARALALDMLERVGLSHRVNHYPRFLSGGEQQRVAIARALVHKPSLILADEPTGNLDDKTGQQIEDLLFALHAETDATLVIVTHDMHLASRCKRQFHIESGQLLEAGKHVVEGSNSGEAQPGQGQHSNVQA